MLSAEKNELNPAANTLVPNNISALNAENKTGIESGDISLLNSLSEGTAESSSNKSTFASKELAMLKSEFGATNLTASTSDSMQSVLFENVITENPDSKSIAFNVHNSKNSTFSQVRSTAGNLSASMETTLPEQTREASTSAFIKEKTTTDMSLQSDQSTHGHSPEIDVSAVEVGRKSNGGDATNKGNILHIESTNVSSVVTDEPAPSNEPTTSLFNSPQIQSSNTQVQNSSEIKITNETETYTATTINTGGSKVIAGSTPSSEKKLSNATITSGKLIDVNDENVAANELTESASTLSSGETKLSNKRSSPPDQASNYRNGQEYNIDIEKQASFKNLGVKKETLKDDIVEIVKSVNLIDGENIVNTKDKPAESKSNRHSFQTGDELVINKVSSAKEQPNLSR